jgi:hypothetical protein
MNRNGDDSGDDGNNGVLGSGADQGNDSDVRENRVE